MGEDRAHWPWFAKMNVNITRIFFTIVTQASLNLSKYVACLDIYIYTISLHDNFAYIKTAIKDLFRELLSDLTEYICHTDNVKFK